MPELPAGRLQRGLAAGLLGLLGLLGADIATAQPAAVSQAIEEGRLGDAESLLRRRLDAAPDDLDARFQLARVLAWRGERRASLAQYDQLLATRPDHVDWLLGKAQVLVWDGQAEAAVGLLERARGLAPDYAAVWQLELQALRQSAPVDGQRIEELRRAARVRFPDADWIDAAPSPVEAARRSQLEVAFAYESLDNGFDDWQELSLLADRRLAGERTLYGRARTTQRFSDRDAELALGAYLPLGAGWLAVVEGGIAPGADVLPRWSGYAQLQRAFAGGFGLHAGLRRSAYSNSDVSLLTLSAERYFGNYRAGYTLYAGRPDGASTGYSHVLQLDRYYAGHSRIGLLIADGEEVEAVGAGQVVVTDVQAIAVAGRHWFHARWGLSWELAYHEQGELYRKTRARIGLAHRF